MSASAQLLAISVVLNLLAPAAAAQDVVLEPAQVEACFAATPTGTIDPSCLGAASNACQQLTPGGQTTLGITNCIVAETAVWDAILNNEYGKTRDSFAAQAGLADELLAAQRAWIAFRDAECALAYLRFGDGSMRTIAGANCQMVMTARRALELRDMRGF